MTVEQFNQSGSDCEQKLRNKIPRYYTNCLYLKNFCKLLLCIFFLNT